METNIHIPAPCHENWNNMLPADQGRHCLTCCKTVALMGDTVIVAGQVQWKKVE